jgi:hypothetical protein
MPIAFVVGPLAALIGIVAVFFVFRRKAVDKRSMYSARRSQIEHKVRAARQRTLAPHGHEQRPPEAAAEAGAAASPFTSTPRGPQITYEASAYEPPPAAPPPVSREVRDAPSASPWDVGGTTAPAPTEFVTPEAPPVPMAPEPAYAAPPIEEVWTPAPPPAAPVEPARPAAAAASPAAWSVVQEAKGSGEVAGPESKPKKKKGKHEEPGASWTLASGNAPGMEPDEISKAPSPLVPIAQYLVLVVGLVMVLIGVFVMIANSHVT